MDTARVEDSGMGKFSFFNPSKWNFIASFIFFIVSSEVEPVAIQPGKSGQYAI